MLTRKRDAFCFCSCCCIELVGLVDMETEGRVEHNNKKRRATLIIYMYAYYDLPEREENRGIISSDDFP